MNNKGIINKCIGIIFFCVSLCGCAAKSDTALIQNPSEEQGPDFIYGKTGELVPGTKHYQLACENQANCFVLEGDNIYRIDEDKKTKIVSEIGILYFGATDQYVYYYFNSSKTDRINQLCRMDIRLKLEERFIFDEHEAYEILTEGDTAYVQCNDLLLCYVGEDILLRESEYVIEEEENIWEKIEDKENFANQMIQELDSYEAYYLEWEHHNLYVFGTNDKADYVFLKRIENPLELQEPSSRVTVKKKEDISQEEPAKEIVYEEGTFDGYDEFGNGYLLKDGIKFFDRDCPYELRDMKEVDNVITWYQEGKDMDVSMIICEEFVREMVRKNKEEESNVTESFSMTGGLDAGPCVGVYNERVIYHCTVKVTFAEE